MATKKAMIEIVKRLLDRGSDVSSRNKVFLMNNLIYYLNHNCTYRIHKQFVIIIQDALDVNRIA